MCSSIIVSSKMLHPRPLSFTIDWSNFPKIIQSSLLLFLRWFFMILSNSYRSSRPRKTTFNCPSVTFAYIRIPFGLCKTPAEFQMCMMAIFHDMIKTFMEIFMNDFSVFGSSFQDCLSELDQMLACCEKTNLILNWEKCHFMVKEGIVLGHKISKMGIQVDRAKVDTIENLPHHTNVKGVRIFLAHAGFYHRIIKDFSKIARPLTQHLLMDDSF